MIFKKTKLDGVYTIESDAFQDERGKLVKTYHLDMFLKQHIRVNFIESYYSLSKKNVLRGMHFQIPPQDHAKLVYVSRGIIIDVVLDIQKGSPTYGEYISVELSDKNHKMMYIPTGFAHGFLSLRNHSCVTYLQTTMRSAEHEGGIRVDSFGMDWGVMSPIISERDKGFPQFVDFKTPFIYKK